MSSRTYLSIGDVLTLLREEFPDVTISKIRFLESQGLVNPERSPSGYRKFFEHDVERLRWVLRQQREHFLPLKVIRDRLADGELDDLPADRANGKPAEPVGRHAATVAPEDEQPTKADEEAMARILADASRRAALLPEAAQARRGLQVVGEPTAADMPPAPATVAPVAPTPPGRPGGPERAAPGTGPTRPEVAVGARAGAGASAGAARVAPQDRTDASGTGASTGGGTSRARHRTRRRRGPRQRRPPQRTARPAAKRNGAGGRRRPRPRPAW